MKLYSLRTHIHTGKLPKSHLPANGCTSKNVLVRCKSLKELAEILNTSVYDIRTYGYNVVTGVEKFEDIAVKDRTIYYDIGHTKTGVRHEWVELTP